MSAKCYFCNHLKPTYFKDGENTICYECLLSRMGHQCGNSSRIAALESALSEKTAALKAANDDRTRMQSEINATHQWLSDNNFKSLDEVESLASESAAREKALREAVETITDIARGLRKCRHGRTCCAENDNTVGAINEMVKTVALLSAPTPPSTGPTEKPCEVCHDHRHTKDGCPNLTSPEVER